MLHRKGYKVLWKCALTVDAQIESLMIGEYDKLVRLQNIPTVAHVCLNSFVPCYVKVPRGYQVSTQIASKEVFVNDYFYLYKQYTQPDPLMVMEESKI